MQVVPDGMEKERIMWESPWRYDVPALALFAAIVLPAMSILAAEPPRPSTSPRPLIGAIRWDAWQEDSTVRAAVEKSLGPEHWHDRLPFFTAVPGPDSVSFRDGNTQATMDQEIAYAKQAGVDYWAFDIYPADIGMSNALKLYLASAHKADVRFVLNLQGGWLAREQWPAQVTRYVTYFKEESYQKVLGNRPLVYLFDAQSMIGLRFPDWPAAKAAFAQLRQATVAAGLGEPYIVIQGWAPQSDKGMAESLGADAIGAYALGCKDAATPYAGFAAQGHRRWDQQKATGANVVPLASAGWDPRPRREHPVSWTTYPGNDYTVLPTAAELTTHLLDALNWAAANKQVVPANTILIYSWNEHDEGGWICPTLKGDGTFDASRVEAVRESIRQFEAARP